MAQTLEIDLGDMPAGGAIAHKAFIRPGAVLARVLLEQGGVQMSRRVDLGKNVFIDHAPETSGPGSAREAFPDIQTAAICQKIAQAIAPGGLLAEAYRQPPAPATVVLYSALDLLQTP